MGIEFPFELEVTCDGCGNNTISVATTEYCGDPITIGLERDNIEDVGWFVIGGEYFCPDCAEDKELDN